jgi:hypothetical protein
MQSSYVVVTCHDLLSSFDSQVDLAAMDNLGSELFAYRSIRTLHLSTCISCTSPANTAPTLLSLLQILLCIATAGKP